MRRAFAGLACFSLLVSGCSSPSGGAPDRSAGNASPGGKPVKRATLYVESKGEPANTGGRKAEKVDEGGNPLGEFKPGDLLVPGMMLLVSAGTAVGGTYLVKAIDRDRRSDRGPELVGVDEDGGAVMTIDAPPGTGSGGGGSSGTEAASGGAEGGSGAAPIDPGSVTVAASPGSAPGAVAVASGGGVVSTLSSVVLEMGYTTAHTGPTWLDITFRDGSTFTHASTTFVTWSWELMVETTDVARGTEVDVFLSVTGVPDGSVLCVTLSVPPQGTLTADRPGLIRRLPETAKGEPVGSAWHYKASTYAWLMGTDHLFVFRAVGGAGPQRIGKLKVNEDFTLRLTPASID
ncbi:MAG: hypothetical protein HUU15_05015 [Candidatus Brocadiae bacterium]|nr:hypothetical protein [Candidatus Brocadiia bacterium]